ncbi:hypothetical protein RYH73_18455 [Olivibacter sp. CPCC 100613]|uniref:hypothetical protein n=1 Tax=Olivibacter sp. CPCC 100613 TaxID=3079931 RepID=UPI002FF9C41D
MKNKLLLSFMLLMITSYSFAQLQLLDTRTINTAFSVNNLSSEIYGWSFVTIPDGSELAGIGNPVQSRWRGTVELKAINIRNGSPLPYAPNKKAQAIVIKHDFFSKPGYYTITVEYALTDNLSTSGNGHPSQNRDPFIECYIFRERFPWHTAPQLFEKAGQPSIGFEGKSIMSWEYLPGGSRMARASVGAQGLLPDPDEAVYGKPAYIVISFAPRNTAVSDSHMTMNIIRIRLYRYGYNFGPIIP